MLLSKIENFLLHRYRFLRYPHYRSSFTQQQEKAALLAIPRYTSGVLHHLFAHPLRYLDSLSSHFIYREVFEEEIYKFETSNSAPYIIDAGANIGLSVIYFKQLYPQAEVVAFEPDEKVYEVLSANVKEFQLAGVTLEKKALWNEETVLTFYPEGADAGRVYADGLKDATPVKVNAVRLRHYLLHRKVDMLKIDIEGAETEVLQDCADALSQVDRIFVEYHSFEQKEQQLPALLELLKSAGFRLAISSPGLRSRSPFMKVETYSGMDMQLNIYGFRS